MTASLSLDDFFYAPGAIPTICFTSTGIPRQAAPIGNQYDVFLSFSTVPNPLTSTQFPPFLMGKIVPLGSIDLALNQVSCASPDQFIRAVAVDRVSGKVMQVSNEVQLMVDRSNCNPGMPVGGQGCGPEYWKNPSNSGMWPIPLLPATKFVGIFDDAFPGKGLSDVLAGGNGSLRELGRQAVAALLNAESPAVNYDLTSGEIIALFDRSYPGSTIDYNSLAALLEGFNEQGCLLTESARRSPER